MGPEARVWPPLEFLMRVPSTLRGVVTMHPVRLYESKNLLNTMLDLGAQVSVIHKDLVEEYREMWKCALNIDGRATARELAEVKATQNQILSEVAALREDLRRFVPPSIV